MKYNLWPKRTKGILSKTLDGETVILKKDDWRCFLLNPTASFIWRLSNGKNSIKNLSRALSIEYDIKGSVAQKDISVLLSHLKRQGLIDFVKKRAAQKCLFAE